VSHDGWRRRLPQLRGGRKGPGGMVGRRWHVPGTKRGRWRATTRRWRWRAVRPRPSLARGGARRLCAETEWISLRLSVSQVDATVRGVARVPEWESAARSMSWGRVGRRRRQPRLSQIGGAGWRRRRSDWTLEGRPALAWSCAAASSPVRGRSSGAGSGGEMTVGGGPWLAEVGRGSEASGWLGWVAVGGSAGESGSRGTRGEEGLREEGDGVRVRVGCCVIYQGNTMRTIGSTIDGCKLLGYLGRYGLLCYCFSFSFFLFIAPL
jgi:hypothetical protein